MKTYIFKTEATMKAYNANKFWIAENIVPEFKTEAENIHEASQQYRNFAMENGGIEISNHALKNKNALYVDTKSGIPKQIGYVITGKTEFLNDDTYKWTKQYIELWTTVLTVTPTEF